MARLEDFHHSQSEINQSVQVLYTPNGNILRIFTPKDAPYLFALIDRNRAYLSQHGNTTAVNYPDYNSALESIVHPTNPAKLRFGIWTPVGDYVGTINLTPASGSAEIGYYVGQEFAGQGFATDAVRALTGFCLNRGVEPFARVHRDNPASARVLQKAGYHTNSFPDSDNYLRFSL